MPFLPPNQQRQSTEGKNKGKAPGIDNLTPEHIIFAHPILVVHFSLLFKYSTVPDSFGYGVVVPLVKILMATVSCLTITEL